MADTATTNSITTALTAEQIAKQFGLKSDHGTYAWRVKLNSPLDSQRCQVMIAELAKADTFVHQRKPEDASVPFNALEPTTLVLREPPFPVIEELFNNYGAELATACNSQLNEPGWLAWAKHAHPLLSLLKECSFLPEFADFVRDHAVGKKLYASYIRGIIKALKVPNWVENLGKAEEVEDDRKYSAIHNKAPSQSDLDVMACLQIGLPTLLNILTALASVPFTPGNAKALENTRNGLQPSVDRLAQLSKSEEHAGLIWDENGEGTELGNRVAYVYDTLTKVIDTLRV
ncbi:hypothetical protein EXIGLDRAFT_746423, partial [Exidia glandulosa HHB12029]